MKAAVIIPSRIGSTRLPCKPLHLIGGVSLIERVWRRCAEARGVDMLAVATDSEEIASHVKGFGGEIIMTPAECASGTERVAVAAASLSESYDVIINVQGDEPLVESNVITDIQMFFERNVWAKIVTPVTQLLRAEDLIDPNVVKAVLTSDGRALYFSRSPIPYVRDTPNAVQNGSHWKHIGIYGFRRKTLGQVVELLPSSLEEAEKLEQLRWLEGGYSIHTIQTSYDGIAVDTIEDVQKIERMMS